MKHYKCERCNEYKESLDNMMTVGISLAKYVEELERQRRDLRAQVGVEVEARIKIARERDGFEELLKGQ